MSQTRILDLGVVLAEERVYRREARRLELLTAQRSQAGEQIEPSHIRDGADSWELTDVIATRK